MAITRVQKKIGWTTEDDARHRAIRERFKDKLTIEQLVAQGELSGELVDLGTYIDGLVRGTECGTINNSMLATIGLRGLAMLVITRIPTHRNDGSKVGRREQRTILSLVRDTFGGYSLEGPFQGA